MLQRLKRQKPLSVPDETSNCFDSTSMDSLAKQIDSEWFRTAEGEQYISQLFNASNGSRKQFGLLERPNLPTGTAEITYKICLVGKAGSGKSKVVSFLSGTDAAPNYSETIGIRVKDIYWPVRLKGKILLFRIQFWEGGEMCSKKYSYISSCCLEKTDAVAAVISKSDKASLEYLESKYDALIAACSTLFVFVLDSDQESSQIGDHDLLDLARSKRLPLFHLPNHPLSPKYLAPLLNSLCDFLYTSRGTGCLAD